MHPFAAQVDDWVSDPSTTIDTYGRIGTWCTTEVTDMSGLFNGHAAFNDDIGAWNTAAVTSIRGIFESASNFDRDLSTWDTTRVTDMSKAFYEASAFNQNLAPWCDADGVLEYQDFKGTKCAKPKCGADGNGDCCCSCR